MSSKGKRPGSENPRRDPEDSGEPSDSIIHRGHDKVPSFAIVPLSILREHTNLKRDELRMYIALKAFADERGRCFPKQGTLSAILDVPRSTLQRLLSALQRRDLVRSERWIHPKRGGLGPNTYFVGPFPQVSTDAQTQAQDRATVEASPERRPTVSMPKPKREPGQGLPKPEHNSGQRDAQTQARKWAAQQTSSQQTSTTDQEGAAAPKKRRRSSLRSPRIQELLGQQSILDAEDLPPDASPLVLEQFLETVIANPDRQWPDRTLANFSVKARERVEAEKAQQLERELKRDGVA